MRDCEQSHEPRPKRPGLTLLLILMSCDPAFLTGYLERIKSELEGAGLEKKIPKTGSLVDGMDQAILDIVTGMRDLTAYLT